MEVSNSYARLDEKFFQRIAPSPVNEPKLFLWNRGLADDLEIPRELSDDPSQLAGVFSGNRILPDFEPIALAYAGHQFGNFVPQLGDGRAHLLAEVIDRFGERKDIQLKGSGQTQFSRNGDGRCAMGPAVREFVMSEAMHAFGIPTTRSLAVVTTGEVVMRERPLPGAIVTRVAASHLRVGTFEFFAALGDAQAVQTLCDYAIDRHYPDLKEIGEDKILRLLDQVIERQVQLIVEWMRVGFIHGVMNTDNTAISGETIDFGPCAMMSVYDPNTVFSSIDRRGRYAFGNQPAIAQWNMARLAEALLPVMGPDPKKAVAAVTPLIESFPARFEQSWLAMMAAKLGLEKNEDHKPFILDFLNTLQEQRLDYTLTFHRLTKSLENEEEERALKGGFGNWYTRWRERIGLTAECNRRALERMQRSNPVVIPRNHHMEAVLQECAETGSPASAERFLKVLRSPYLELPETAHYQDPPTDADIGYRTFCGT